MSDKHQSVRQRMDAFLTPERRRKVEERRRAIEAEDARRAGFEGTFQHLVGERYTSCTFQNFQCRSQAMRDVRDECQRIADNITAELNAGRGLVLAGPVGTGKDHLTAAMMREVLKAGRTCLRIDGAQFAAQCRDLIGGHVSEGEFLHRWVSPDLLVMSDPTGDRERASEFMRDWLLRIVDGRYRQRRSTWMTINASTPSEIADCIGERTWDRLKDKAIIIRTTWSTHRSAANVVNTPGPRGKASE